MLPHIPQRFDFIHLRSKADLPHLGMVILLITGIAIGVYLSLQPQIFSKKASEGDIIDIKFDPDTIKVQRNGIHEAKIAVNPKSQRATAMQLQINYDPGSVTVLESKNEGFLPVTLKTKDDFNGTLTLTYGGTVETQATQPAVAATVKFKFIGDKPSEIKIMPGSQISVSSREGNVLNQFPILKLDTGNAQPGQAPNLTYPNNLLQEKPVLPESSPFIEDFKQALEPDPEIKPDRVEPSLTEAYIKQLGKDIFVEPIVALNEVIEDKASEILQPE